MVLGLASCQTEPEGINVDANGEAAVTLNVALPDDATRAAGKDSAKGGVENVDLANDYDIRYILEVYDENGKLAKERMTEYSDASSASFTFRLVPGRPYKFVVWADFVAQVDVARDPKANYDLHYNTANGLRAVKVKMDSWTVIDESRDAYTAVETVANFSSAADIPTITLTRPFAKLRVVTNDITEMISIRPTEVKVNYFSTKFYDTFDAYDSKTTNNLVDAPVNLTAILSDDTYTGENPNKTGIQTLFADYFFGAEQDRVMFTMDVKDNSTPARDLPQVTFNTNIPVKRNNLTTVYGPVLTDANNITVTIDPTFENGTEWNPEDDKYDVAVWDGKSSNEPKKDAEGNYLITTGAELAWIADQVNGVTRADVNTFKNDTFLLMNDIDLGGNEWTPIGTGGYTYSFNGTFDGQGNTIANFRVTNSKCAGLIGGTTSAFVKNLTIDNVVLTTNHYAGAIIAWAESGATNVKIEGCTVKNAKITVTPELVGDKYDNGDKAGAIIGFSHVALISGCAAENVEVTAFRDVAAIAGYANKGTVKNCTVKNATITSDQIIEYNGEKDGNAGVFVGRFGEAADTTGNTEGEDVVVIRKVDSTKEFEYALNDRRNEDVIYVGEGEVVLPASLAVSGNDKLTIEGLDAKAAVQFNKTPGGADGGLNCYADGTELIFKNIKVVSPNTGSAYTGGFGRAKSVLFDNCYYEGQYRSMSYVKFNKCTIDPKTSYIYTDYSDADFVECTFNCSEGKGIQVYNDGNTTNTTINVTDCEFTAAKHGQTWDKKPVTAIDINSNGEKFTVNINNTTATGFPKGEYTDETLFNIKGGGRNINIYVDGTLWVAPYKPITDENGNTVEGVLANPEGDIQITADQGWDYFAETVLDGESYAGKLVTLTNDIDFTGQTVNPVGFTGGTPKVFEGTFDGNGKTIKNINQQNLSGSYNQPVGLFSKVNNATFKNINLESFSMATYGSEAGGIATWATGDCAFENITVKDGSVVAYNCETGGVLGWAESGNFTFKDITIAEDVAIHSLWDSYDTPVGGLIGGVGNSSGYTMSVDIEDVTIACKLDVYNDVGANYQWGAYRRAGMIIGNIRNTQDIGGTTYPNPAAENVTCKNVTVIYGDWMNYHYCEFKSNGHGSYDDEYTWKCTRVEASDWGSGGIDTDNCTHESFESHNMCLPVDQLFGGGQGVYGLAEYPGVTVNYPASYNPEN